MTTQTHSDKARPLLLALALTLGFFFVEAIGGFILGSLSLIADASHMLMDVTAISVALIAIKLAQRPPDTIKTYGYHRFEILAAAFNSFLLILLALYIFYQSYLRISNPRTIQSLYMFIIASLGLLVNIASIYILKAHKDANLNIKAVYIDVLSDMLGSIGVIIGAVIIYYWHWMWVDSAIATIIGLWWLPRAWSILKDSLNILLEGVPKGINLLKIKQALCNIKGVTDIHDLHVWGITMREISLTVHVVVEPHYAGAEVSAQMREVLQSKFKIKHVTIQVERKNCLPDNEENLF